MLIWLHGGNLASDLDAHKILYYRLLPLAGPLTLIYCLKSIFLVESTNLTENLSTKSLSKNTHTHTQIPYWGQNWLLPFHAKCFISCVSLFFFSDVGSVLWTFGATVNIGYFWPRLVRQSMGIAISPVDNSLTKFSGGEPGVTKFLYLLTFFIVFELLTEGHV